MSYLEKHIEINIPNGEVLEINSKNPTLLTVQILEALKEKLETENLIEILRLLEKK